MQEPARPHFSFLSPVNSRFCSSQLQVLVLRLFSSVLLSSVVSKSSLLSARIWIFFLFSFFYLFLVSFTLFSQTHWLLSSGWRHCWLPRGRGCTSPQEQWIFPIICLSPSSPPFPRSPPPSELTHHPALFRGNLRVLREGGASSKSPLRQTKRSGVVFTGQHCQQSQALWMASVSV